MPTIPVKSNPLLVDLLPPFREPQVAQYGSIALIFAIILTLVMLLELIKFRDPMLSVVVGLWIFVWFSHKFKI